MRLFEISRGMKTIRLAFLVSITVAGFLVASGYSVPPLDGIPRPEGQTCFINRQTVQAKLARQLKFAPGLAPPISATTAQILVIRVDFPSPNQLTTNLNDATDFFNDVNQFYLENSYGLFSASFTITNCAAPANCGVNGAYRMPSAMSVYGNDTVNFGIGGRDDTLVLDAVTEADQNYDFSAFDHYMFYHAGNGQETSGLSSDIWSVFITAPVFGLNQFATADGKAITNTTMVPEKETGTISPLGVICHEYGHQLGLPDLYNSANNQAAVIGNWSLMDSGVFIGSPLGSNPSHLSAWSKQFLGFSSPQTITVSASSNRTLIQAEISRGSFLRLPIQSSTLGSENEYFLLEYRRLSGVAYDRFIPGQGLLIWHIDDTIASNSSRLSQNTVNTSIPNFGVDLVEADGTAVSNADRGQGSDAWTNLSNVFQTPQADAFNGQDSGIIISNITSPGQSTISFLLRTTLSNPAIDQNITEGRVVVTGGDNGYVNPAKGEKALVGFRPVNSGNVEIKIYSLTGDLVKETVVQGTSGQTTTIPWDGKNPDGKTVSSGVYLIHISGGGIDLKKKTVIVK